MTSLTDLELKNNNLTGTLPPEWSAMRALTTLFLDGNMVTGTLPSAWSGLASLTSLALNNNNLAGSLPSEWSAMTLISYVNLNVNQLTGTLPASWSAMMSLKALTLSDNAITGTLPPEWNSFTQVIQLDLSHNEIAGSLPNEWQGMASIFSLDCNFNQLSGTLPANWAQGMSLLNELGLRQNNLSGTLPADWGPNLQILHRLDVAFNSLSGTLPDKWSSLSYLATLLLSANNISGTLPATWGALVRLKQLDLSSNSLTGSLPASWSNLSSLQSMLLGNNKLNGTIPVDWTGPDVWLNLTSVNVSGNGISGASLPSRWLTDCDMEVVDVSSNRFQDIFISPDVASAMVDCPNLANETPRRIFNLCGNTRIFNSTSLKKYMQLNMSLRDRFFAFVFPSCSPPSLPTGSRTASEDRPTSSKSSSIASSLSLILASPSSTASRRSLTGQASATTSSSHEESESLSIYLPRPGLPSPTVPIVSTAAEQATAVAVVVSTVVAAVAGPTGAADVQAVAVLLMMPCKASSRGKSGSYKLLSPVALSDTAEGVVEGNAALSGSIALAQVIAIVLLRHRMRLAEPRTATACAMVRFPGMLLSTMTSLFQGTFVASLALLLAEKSAVTGVLSILWCVVVPLSIGLAVCRFPRRFVTYSYHGQSSFALFRRILPIGVVMPDNVRKASLALISGYSKPLLGFALTPFMSPILLGVLSSIPARSVSSSTLHRTAQSLDGPSPSVSRSDRSAGDPTLSHSTPVNCCRALYDQCRPRTCHP